MGIGTCQYWLWNQGKHVFCLLASMGLRGRNHGYWNFTCIFFWETCICEVLWWITQWHLSERNEEHHHCLETMGKSIPVQNIQLDWCILLDEQTVISLESIHDLVEHERAQVQMHLHTHLLLVANNIGTSHIYLFIFTFCFAILRYIRTMSQVLLIARALQIPHHRRANNSPTPKGLWFNVYQY